MRDSSLLSKNFHASTDYWLRAMLPVVMCGVGMSGRILYNDVKYWMNPHHMKMHYDPDAFLYLINLNKIQHAPERYIDNYFNVTPAGVFMCAVKYLKNLRYEHIRRQWLEVVNNSQGSEHDNRVNDQLKRKYREYI